MKRVKERWELEFPEQAASVNINDLRKNRVIRNLIFMRNSNQIDGEGQGT